jgi:hypothetical protein
LTVIVREQESSMSALEDILARADAGESVVQIAATVEKSAGHVYAVLREHRPDRPRKAREATSDIPRMIRGLSDGGMLPRRIAAVLGCSRAYVYRCLSD